MADNFSREGKNVNKNINNNKNVNDNFEFSNHCDLMFAQLTDMFGDVLSSENILSVCHKTEWDLSSCIETLIQASEEQLQQQETTARLPENKNTSYSNERDVNINVNTKPNPNCNDVMIFNDTKNSGYVANELENLRIAYQNADSNSGDEDDVQFDDDADIVIESEEQILDLPKTENIPNDSNNVNLGAIKKQLTFKNSPTENINNQCALQSFNFSSLLKQGDNHLFNLSNNQGTLSLNKNSKTQKIIRKSPNYDKIVHLINQGVKVMVLMRGAPGCGKSYLARQIIDDTINEPYTNHIFSSDNYFYDAKDRYQFHPDKVSESHDFNQKTVNKKCHEGWSPIIVDNTNIQIWEMYPYIDMAVQCGYFIEILEPLTPWSNSPRQLSQKNIHNVPVQKIDRMLNNYQKINVYNLLKIRGLQFHLTISPQLRRYPILNPKIDNNEVEQQIHNQIQNDVQNCITTNSNMTITVESQNNTATSRINNINNNETGISLISDKLPIPHLPMKREWGEDWIDNSSETDGNKSNKKNVETNQPKPPRQFKRNNISNEIITNLNQQIDASDIQNLIDWKAHDQEMRDFWTKANNEQDEKNITPKTIQQPKTQRIHEKQIISFAHENKFEILIKDEIENVITASNMDEETNDIVNLDKHKIDCNNENKSFSQIRQIYPSVPIEYLWDLFVNCQGDGDWTMDILLKDESKLSDFMNSTEISMSNFECSCSTETTITTNKISDLMSFEELPTKTQSPPTTNNHVKNINTPVTPISSPSTHKSSNKKDKTVLSEELQNAKRQIEEKITFGDEHYSNHARKIRDIRRGIQTTTDLKSPASGGSLNEFGAGFQSDLESRSNDDTESTEDNEELIEINLGKELVAQLDNMFGVETFSKNTLNSMKSNVFMPKTLCKQLYALWMESVYNQHEEQKQQSIKEDEEFARMLYSKEKYPSLHKQPSSFKEIMEMQYTWEQYKSEIDEWKNTTPETIASKLSREKLQNIFPDVDKDLLDEILCAHNNKFDETVSTLKDTLQCDTLDTVVTDGNNLFEQARLEIEMPDENFQLVNSPSTSSIRSLEKKKLGAEEAKRLALKEFEDCRNSAMHHAELKTECFQKAQNAIGRGETGVALYYSQVAKLHKNKLDMYNQKAANCIMEVHDLTQNNPDIVDLHYLRVTEAVECLDIFLDKHISKLKTSPQYFKYVHVITGRGLHSARGIPTVKHNVKNRLADRNLKYVEINPGLLKVKVFTNSKLSQV